jgi:hypothetical protein
MGGAMVISPVLFRADYASSHPNRDDLCALQRKIRFTKFMGYYSETMAIKATVYKANLHWPGWQ